MGTESFKFKTRSNVSGKKERKEEKEEKRKREEVTEGKYTLCAE